MKLFEMTRKSVTGTQLYPVHANNANKKVIVAVKLPINLNLAQGSCWDLWAIISGT